MLRILFAFPLLFVCGCLVEPGALQTGASAPVAAGELGRVAIVPFESLSGQPNAGLILAGQMAGALSGEERLELIPQDVAAAALAPKEGEVLSPDTLGTLLQAKTLLLGSVSEYRYKRGVGEEPVVGLSLRLVDAKSGRILWRAERTRIGTWSWWREDSLSRLGGAVCRDLARSLSKALTDG